MFEHRIVACALVAFGLSIGCAHKQQVKPPVAPAPQAAKATAEPAAPAPAPTVVETAKPFVLAPIHFDFDRSEILPGDRDILERLGNRLIESSAQSVVIAGHCDERGTVEYNIALGDRRANAAREYLIRLGVAAERIRTISFGEAVPSDPGHDEQAWAKNRRDEFTVETKKAER